MTHSGIRTQVDRFRNDFSNHFAKEADINYTQRSIQPLRHVLEPVFAFSDIL